LDVTGDQDVSLIALVFMGLLAGLTSSVHFVILTVSRQAAFTGQSWLPLLLEFKWPSVAYALDILAWDVFFPLAVLSAAPVFGGSRLTTNLWQPPRSRTRGRTRPKARVQREPPARARRHAGNRRTPARD
jgi:hypothetical protein